MEMREALQWTDHLIFNKTGKHLDSLQRAILEGVWEGKGYKDISEKYQCTSDHVRKSASDLWKLLSDLLGENVKKKNVRSLIENQIFSYYNNGVQIANQINVCSDLYGYPKSQKKRSPQDTTTPPPPPRHDLSQAPENSRRFCDRTQELATLKQWILEEHSRIVSLTGLSGIGKTALARKLVEEIKDHFDRTLWRSHRQFPNFNALQSHIIESLAPPPPSHNPSIINYLNSRNSFLDHLRNHRCLIILDDFQETLNPGELVGNYRPEYQNYSHLLHEIGRCSHQSCLLLLGWEQPLEIATMEAEENYGKTLQIAGLGKSASQLLTARKLKDKPEWSKLIELYNGNPLWLSIIATDILELFNGSVQKFLSYPTLYLGSLETLIKPHYQRLSEVEKILMGWLANQEKAVDISQKPPELLSDADFLKGIQSLNRRNFLNKSSGFTLQPVIKQYVKNLIS